ncbi:MAG: filamentous hemagglutinin N-terminal domain-containing protein, partial [Candidatus Methylumidiphilus sp.]
MTALPSHRIHLDDPRRRRVWLAVRGLLAGIAVGGHVAAAFELPVPSAVLAASGHVLPPVVSGNTMNIRQLSEQATLDWQSFNIGAENAVRFEQPQASSVALNRIHQADPSRIFGQLSANGQVYLVNQNGFVFGGGAQVNANTLVATTLDIAEDTLRRGLTKVVDSAPADGPVAALAGNGRVWRIGADGNPEKIAIRVEAGAEIKTNAAGGRILLAAPSLVNQGQIQANDGQVILAAATDKVYLQEADPNAGLRGVWVEVQTGGDLANLGKVLAERGNVSLIGFALRQQGVVSASTSVALNGSVRLLAREGAALQQHNGAYTLLPQTTLRGSDNGDGLGMQASVTLQGGSRTGVELDDRSGSAVDEQVQPRSRIDIEAGRITLELGALIQAAHGQVKLTASASPDRPLAKTSADNPSRIELQAGSRIDVSGDSRTVLPMSRNLVNVELRANELRDAPLQKTGVLYGKTVQVDVRAADKNGHIPIADISGALARIQRSVGERNADGGTVNLASEGAALLNSGAEIDLSGGVIRYLGGFLNTTRLLGADGQLYDIGKADPLRSYPQIFGTFSKYWRRFGITETWDLPGPLRSGVYEPGYQEGRAAGSLNIQSREVLLEAAVLARTVDGILQRRARAAGGQLSIDTAWSGERQQAVTWGGAAAGQPAPLALSDAVFSAGLRHVRINSMGRISIPEGVAVQVPANGSLDLTGGEISMLGSVYAPAGIVSLQTQPVAGNSPSLSGDIRLSPDSRIDVSGRWINELPRQAGQTPPSLGALPIDGGQVTLYAQGGLDLAAGSQIKADGGAWLHVGQTVAGQGGHISLKVAKPDGPSPLTLGAQLSSFALAQGGSLDITANALRLTTAQPTADSLNISPDLLENRGFSQIKLTANAGDLTVDEGLSLSLRMLNFDLPTRTTDLAATPTPTLIHLPDALRQPVSLSLALKQNPGVGGYQQDRALTLGAGAAINADPGATLSLSSDANIRLNGRLSAAAGRIDAKLEAAAYPALPDYNPNQALALGPQAQLSTAGVALLEPNTQGLNIGEVRPGGAVALRAERGYIVMDRQARIDVSGTASPIDRFVEGGSRIGAIVRETVASAAGDISLSAAEGMVLDGMLLGRPGGPQAGGGSLTLELNAQRRAEPRADNGDISANFPSGPRIVHLSAEAPPPLPADWFASPAIDANRNGQAYWSAAQFIDGGFSALTLKSSVIVPAKLGAQQAGPEIGAIQFDGDVTLDAARSLVLDAPVFSADGEAVLRSSHAALGSSLNQHGPDLATQGAGQLRVEAGWIDLTGAVATQGIRATALRSAADIRLIGVNPLQEADLQGEFVSPGDIALSARQIYPSTFSQYRIAAGGRIEIGPGDATAAVPLSAASRLSLSAAQIESFGVLRAPFGEIDLQAADTLALQSGSVTSTAAGAALIPFGRTQGGLDWVFPIGAATQILREPPAQALSLTAPDIQFTAGATLDLSGGGDVSAFEFIPGPGGSVDQLDPASVGYQTRYAVLPGLSSPFAPYDPLEFPASGLRMGDSLHLSGGNGLAAGDYVLLPAHYALLPGAFLVTPQAGTLDQRPGVTPTRLDGVPIVAGYRYAQGTAERDSRWSGFAIEPGAIARTRSEFQETTAGQFYARLADAPPLLPQDAGHLSVAAGRALSLAGDLRAAGADGGRGGRLDIIADRLAIVPRRLPDVPTDDGAVRLSAEELKHLQVESLLLGGRRTETGEIVRVAVSADSVTLSAGAQLQGPEILLAAKNLVSMETGAAEPAAGADGGTG